MKVFGAQLHILHGASRWVVVWRRWALKLPYTHSWHTYYTGRLDNMGERDIWRHWPEARPKLAPVLWASRRGGLLVMARVQALTDEEWALIGTPEAHDAWRTVGTATEGYTFPAEFKRSSHGTIDGRIVACDYGVTDDVCRRLRERAARVK